MRRATVTALVFGVVGAGLAVFAACDTTSIYVYNARQYDPARDCLTNLTGLDVLEGDDPGVGCVARCLVGHDVFDGSAVLLGTTECGPVPPGFDDSASNPLCPEVIAALKRDDICDADGGSTNPRDGGADGGDAAGDAADDAGDAASDGASGDASDAATDAATDATDGSISLDAASE